MKQSADLVIIGAGVIGSSVAFQLAKRGFTNVLMLDAGEFGMGTSSKGAGGIHTQFDLEEDVIFSRESLPFFRNLKQEVGDDCDFRQVGNLTLILREERIPAYERMAAQGRRLGVNWTIITPEEAAKLVSGMNIEGIVAASWTPNDGTGSLPRVTRALRERAVEAGVEAIEHVAVTGFVFEGDHLAGLETAQGRVETPRALIATGPWSREVGKRAGVPLNVTPNRRHIFLTDPVADPPKDTPFTFEDETGFYIRKDGERMLACPGDMTPAEDYSLTIDRTFEDVTRTYLARRYPKLANLPFTSARAGLREMTPDAHTIMGEIPGKRGLFVACGFSGHGFVHAPAAGEAMADLITTGRSRFDLSPYRFDRFAG